MWSVAVEEIINSTPARFSELTDKTKNSDAPKGFRTQLNNIRSARLKPSPDSILSNALTVIDYLFGKAKSCRCSTEVDLELEDLVYDTRARILSVINKS